PMTQDEFIQYLKAFQTKYPTIDGKAGVPMTLWAENWGSFMGTFKGMYGLKTYTETDGKLSYDFRDPKYKEMLKYMNGIFQSGLLDKEWATNKEQLWKQKMASGAVFATAEAYWNTEDANKVLKEKGEDCIFLPYQVVANGVDPKKTTYSSRNPMGWDVIGITKSNPNPEKTIKFLDFLASDEGQKLIMGGVEGKQYDVVDGKRVMKPEVIEKVTEDFTAYSKETGVRYWTMCVKNGKAKDGQAFQLSNEYIPNPVKDFALKSLDGTVWDCSPYEDLTPVGGSIDALNYQKISDLSLEYCTKLVNAANDDEFEKLWSSFISEADALGAQKVEEILNQNYQKKMKLWGMDK
ncbi:MAG: ABC transporter substrate-binding protein, partial [Oscillospiraceae bacterium]